MPRVELPFADGFYVSQGTRNVSKRAVNMYPAVVPTGAINQTVLYNTPGIVEEVVFIEFGEGGQTCRGSILGADGLVYFVAGEIFYSVDESFTVTNLGDVDGFEDVSMSSNGLNIVIVGPDTPSVYFYDLEAETFDDSTTNPPAVLPVGDPLKTVTFKSRFYVYNSDDFAYSGSDKDDVDNGTGFNALDFEDAEFNVDIIVKTFNNLNQLYLMGLESIEIYQSIVVTEGFPFGRIVGGTLEIGCRAPNSVQSYDGGFAFLGGHKNQRPGVYFGQGSSFRKISTQAIDNSIDKYDADEIMLARAFTYSTNGASFYVISFVDNTFVYDSTASALAGSPRWHERGPQFGPFTDAWRARYGLLAFGKILVFDSLDDGSGRIGSLSLDVKTEYGFSVDRFFTTQPFINKGQKVFAHEIEIIPDVGVGNDDTENPVVFMSYSDDSGNNFNDEVPMNLGAAGEFNTVVRWTRHGKIKTARIYMFRVSDPVDFNVYSFFANSETYNSG